MQLRTTFDLITSLKELKPKTIPYVKGFRIRKSVVSGSNTTYTLTWVNPEISGIDHYRVYAENRTTKTYSAPVIVTSSPADVTIPTADAGVTTFRVQVIMKAGQFSDLKDCPTVMAG